MIEIKVVRNDVMNNFEIVKNSLIYTIFTPRASEVGKMQPFCRRNSFLSNLEAPREKTVYLREWVMLFKVVVNNIVDIIHFDQNTVQSNLDIKNHQIC